MFSGEKRKNFHNILHKTNVVCVSIVLVMSIFGPINSFSILGKHFSPAFYFAFLFLPLLFLEWAFSTKKSESTYRIFTFFFITFFVLGFVSLINCLLLSTTFDGYYSTTPMKVYLLNFLKYAFDFIAIVYLIFSISFLTKKYIETIVIVASMLLVLIGLFQLFVCLVNNQQLNQIYDNINFLKILGSSELMHLYGMQRIYLTASEPAANCTFVCCVCIPFLFFIAIKKDNLPIKRILAFIILVLLLPLIYFTRGISLYLCSILSFVITFFCFISTMKNEHEKTIVFIVGITALIVLLILLFVTPFGKTLLQSIVDKFLSNTNYSFQYRFSSIYNDILIMLKMPIFGCGDGFQGYFYTDNIVGTWMANNPETINAIAGNTGLLAGGAFIPSYLSGFGIVGLIFLILYFRLTWRELKKGESYLKFAHKISIVMLVIVSSITIGFHYNIALYAVLILPYYQNEVHCCVGVKEYFSKVKKGGLSFLLGI